MVHNRPAEWWKLADDDTVSSFYGNQSIKMLLSIRINFKCSYSSWISIQLLKRSMNKIQGYNWLIALWWHANCSTLRRNHKILSDHYVHFCLKRLWLQGSLEGSNFPSKKIIQLTRIFSSFYTTNIMGPKLCSILLTSHYCMILFWLLTWLHNLHFCRTF